MQTAPVPHGRRSLLCRVAGRSACGLLGLQQLVEVDHHVLHLCVVHGALRAAAPRFGGFGQRTLDANQIELGEIDEIEALRIRDPAPHDKVQFAHCGFASPGRKRMERGPL